MKFVALLLPVLATTAAAQGAVDAGFVAAFNKQFAQVKDLAPDMVVEELRLRVELVASRGSQVGAASNDRRVRGFESELLRQLQHARCPGGAERSAPRPAADVIDGVNQAAATQRLRTEGNDVAALVALSQRVVDSQTPARWCSLRSLDEVR